MATGDEEIPATLKQSIGLSKRHTDEAHRKIAKLAEARRAPSEKPPVTKWDDEDTINKIVDGVAKRAPQPSAPSIHVHTAPKPHSDPPSSDSKRAGFSLRTAGGTKLRATGGQAVSLLAVVAIVALLIAAAAGWDPFAR